MVERLLSNRLTGGGLTAAALVRIGAGIVFLVFGGAKFAHHQMEVDSFDDYGLPSPDAFVYVIGVVEVVGGLLLVLGLLTRLSALMMAGDMVGAIVAAGFTEGGVINLGLAPALLIAMLFLMWAGPGRWSLDERLLARGHT